MEEKLKEIGNELMCPIAIMLRGNDFLTGYRNYTPDKWKTISVWTAPGGRCEKGETLKEALRREVFEEVGITQFDILEYLGQMPGGKEGDIVEVFLCKTEEDYILKEPEKFSEWRWVPKDEYLFDKKYMGFNMGVKNLVIDYFSRK